MKPKKKKETKKPARRMAPKMDIKIDWDSMKSETPLIGDAALKAETPYNPAESAKNFRDPESLHGKTMFQEYLDKDNQHKEDQRDGRTAQERQIEYLMNQLADSKNAIVAQLDAVRLEEQAKTIERMSELNTKLMEIITLLSMGISKFGIPR